MAKNKKSKKQKKSKDQKLNKELKALAKEVKASRLKEAQLVAVVTELTEQVETLQKKIEAIPVVDKDAKAKGRGTTPRGRKASAKTKVASTVKTEPAADSKPKAKRGRPRGGKKATSPNTVAKPVAAPQKEPAATKASPAKAKATPGRKPRTTATKAKAGRKPASAATPKATRGRKPKAVMAKVNTSSARRGRPSTKPAIVGDDLTAINGLGASIDKLLREAGITTYAKLGKLSPTKFRQILQGAGPRYKNKDPQPWIDAAAKLS
jgi:predicted flap endonuclease-1-like 5' DNA nuclease